MCTAPLIIPYSASLITTVRSWQLWEQLSKLEALNAPVCAYSLSLVRCPLPLAAREESFIQEKGTIRCMLRLECSEVEEDQRVLG